ncbi:phosphate-starvation-inducible PsiE family protein [Methanopyrus kandleri]|uniref:Predicted membrane protein n=1 Tax=Methanopyrus kandleri (strain AV19 / DSM 6324 / JCM 9639 / NBRC 100938) TaxID=190192 RepID=Q8TW30_METKA|nr:phosphate-starvation-inducible PsiE family protein [Methanopyrus kandleri]AAM02420.1 Predicted membrane protein [Methanopyrus kandleri AV19]
MSERLNRFAYKFLDITVHIVMISILAITLFIFGVGVYDIVSTFLTSPYQVRFRMTFGLIVECVFDVLLLLEVYQSVLETLRHRRVPLRYVVDITIIMILRETFLKYYRGTIRPMEMLSVTAMLTVLIASRVVVLKYSPDYFKTHLERIRGQEREVER